MSDKNLNGIESDAEGNADIPEATVKKVPKKEKSSVDGGKIDSTVLFHGDIVIKAQLEDDIRCTNYNNQELTFVDLLKLLERMFKKAIKATDDLVIKYKDSDGDYVTMEDTDDVGFAIRACGGLNIKIIRNKKPVVDKLKATDVFREELKEIRDRIDALLGEIDVTKTGHIVGTVASEGSKKDLPGSTTELPSGSASQVSKEPTPRTVPTSSQETTEFDPLSSVSSTGDRRTDYPPTGASTASQVPTSTPAMANQVIDSFQPTTRETQSTSGISSNNMVQKTELQQPSSQLSQHTSSLFNRGGGVAASNETPAVVEYSAVSQSISAPLQYQTAVASAPQQQNTPVTPLLSATSNPGVSQSPYGGTTPGAPPNPYGSTTSVAPPNPYGGATPSHFNQQQQHYLPKIGSYANTSSATMNTTSWGDTNASVSTANRGYQHGMGISPNMGVGGQPGAPPLQQSPAQPGYSTNPQMYGQLGSSQTHSSSMGSMQPQTSMGVSQGPPPMVGGGQIPPPMGGSQGQPPMGGAQAPPPMGAPFRPGGSVPPPPSVGAPGTSTNPYARTANRF